MNKKFSTLVVGTMLLSSVGASAQYQFSNAANAPQSFGYNWKSLSHYVLTDTLTKANGTVNALDSKLLYQLADANGDSVLVQRRDAKTGELYLAMDSIGKAELNSSLWKITVSDDNVSGDKFSFENAETGVQIIFNDESSISGVVKATASNISTAANDSTILNGCLNEWNWYDNAVGAMNVQPMYSRFSNGDSVMVMQLNDDKNVVAVRYHKGVVGSTGVSAITNALQLRPMVASPLVLDPLALNTVVDFQASGAFKLKSSANPTLTSQFIGSEFVAISADAFLKSTAVSATGIVGISDKYAKEQLGLNGSDSLNLYVALQNKATATEYMMVDSVPATGYNDYVALKFSAYNKATSALSDTILATRFLYKFTYYPSQDSLAIEPLNALPKASVGNNYEWRNKGVAYNSYYNNRRAFLAADGQPLASLRDAAQDSVVVTLVELGTTTALTAYNNDGTSVSTPKFSFDGRDLSTKWLKRATLTEGLNYIMTGGKYVVANLVDWTQYDVPTEAQKFTYLPATMWDVQKTGCAGDVTSPVQIANREFTNEVFNGQLYVAADGKLFIINNAYNQAIDNVSTKPLYNKDGFEITTVVAKDGAAAAGIIASPYHGYRYVSADDQKFSEFQLKFNVTDNLTGGKSALVAVDANNNFVATTDGSSTYFQIEELGAATNFGTMGNLKKYAYKLKVRDANLIDNDRHFVYWAEITQADGTKRAYYKAYTEEEAVAAGAKLAKFYLKSDQKDANYEYYTLIDTVGSTVTSGTLVLNNANRVALGDGVQHMTSVMLRNYVSDDIDAFALIDASRPLYQNVDDLNAKTVKIYRERDNGKSMEALYEDMANHSDVANAAKDLGFLGVATGTNFKPDGVNSTTALYLHAIGGEHMPQYMLGVAVDTVKNGKWCDTHGYNPTCTGEHFEPVAYAGYMFGRFLVNLNDSTKNAYKYNNVYSRLAFMEGVVKDGVFYQPINGNTVASLSKKWGVIVPSDFSDATKFAKTTLTKDVHANCLFSLRKITDNGEDFLLETNLAGTSSVGSFKGAWVKIENGVPVLAKFAEEVGGSHDGDEAKVQELVKQAQVFMLKDAEGEIATDNDQIDVPAAVSVIAGEGSVIVKGAAGKTVVISDVLGRKLNATTISSDEATIATAAGVVFVTVEGEAAVKAIVK